jgi:Cu/Ag efflux protein CusF
VTGLGPINATTAGAVGFTISWTATDVVGYRYVFSDGVDVVEGSDTFAAGPTEATVSNVNLTGLDDGPITLTVTVKDGAENEGEYVNATLTKDTGIPDDPTVTGLGPINAATAGAVGFTINWTATDVVGYRYVFSDGVDDVEGSDTFAAGPTEVTVSNADLTGLDDGSITLTVTVKDSAENEGEYVNATLTKDTGIPDDPTVTGLGPINATTAGAVGFTINWTATDVVGYRYVFSDDTAAHDVDVEVAVVAGTTEATVSNVDLTGLDDGPITLTVTVKDSAENEGEYVDATLTKDTGIPDDPTVTGLGPINATNAERSDSRSTGPPRMWSGIGTSSVMALMM